MLKSNMKIKLAVTVLTLALSSAAWSAPGNGRAGLVALQGAAAKGYEVPADVRLARASNLKARGLISHRYQQLVGDAEVLGGQLTVLRSAAGDVIAVTGAHYPGLMSTNDVRLNGNSARGIAAAQIGGAGLWKTRLMINPNDGRYFYIVENRRFDSRWFHWVDAENGSIVNAYDGLTTGSGTGVQGDTKDLTGLTKPNGTRYELMSPEADEQGKPKPRQVTYDAGNANSPRSLPGTLATDDNDTWDTSGTKSPGQPALVDAHFFANVTDDYFLSEHSFDWLDDYPQGMVSSAHVKRNYNNAYWNGSQMAYGDGDGSAFVELSGDLDVVGHELSHGVTEATSNLIYQNESGALNEAFSDIMGTSIEYYHGTGNWTIGEDITPNDNGIRNMANPNEDGDPSHYADRYTGTGDNGGVHINSGIANHWYYLLVNGGQNAKNSRASGTNVQGVGLEAAENIAFLGFTSLAATADFCAARLSTIAVAGDHEANVGDAWDEVGVDDVLCGGGGGSSSSSSGSSSGGDNAGPVITNVESAKIKGVKFAITWTTDVPATSEVTFTCCGTYTRSQLVTGHSYEFNGSKNVTYEFFVTSRDDSGNATTEGPFIHQN